MLWIRTQGNKISVVLMSTKLVYDPKKSLTSVVTLNAVMLNVIMLSVIMLNVIMLNVIMLNVIMLGVVMLNVVTLNVVLLNVIMLNVKMLSVVAPLFTAWVLLFILQCFKLRANHWEASTIKSLQIRNYGFRSKLGCLFKLVCVYRGCIFSHVWPFYERAMSDLDP